MIDYFLKNKQFDKAEIQLKPGFSNTPQRLLYPQVEINSNPNTPKPIPSIYIKTPVNM